MLSSHPFRAELQSLALSCGQDYPDLRIPKEMWVQKISVRNVGKENDQGLYPDPTEPPLQVYVSGAPTDRKTKRIGDGQYYTVLGQFSVKALDQNESFKITVDGSEFGPFCKVVAGPYLEAMKSKSRGVKKNRHLSFDVMAFAPLGTN